MWAWVIAAPMASAAGTWLARGYALRRRLVDEPGERRSHAVATPRGGGIGPVAAIVLVLAVFGANGLVEGADWRWLVAALVLVAGVGAWDDHRPLGAGIRLLAHAIAGVMLAIAVELHRDLAAVAFVVAGVAIAVNAWNFMDGINGIAATQAAIVAATAAALATGHGAMLAWAVALSILAFVPFNFPRARIFMGDVGSGALGLVLAMLALLPRPLDSGRDGLLLLFPAAAFLVDAALTLGMRVVTGERWWTPHTRHLYQVCARRVGHTRVTLAYAAWSVAGALVALMLDGRGIGFILVSLSVWYTSAAGVWACLQYRSRRWSAAA